MTVLRPILQKETKDALSPMLNPFGSNISKYYADFDIAYHFLARFATQSDLFVDSVVDINGNNELTPEGSSTPTSLKDDSFLNQHESQAFSGLDADKGNFDIGTNDFYWLVYARFSKKWRDIGTVYIANNGAASHPQNGYTLHITNFNTTAPVLWFTESNGTNRQYAYGNVPVSLLDDDLHTIEIIWDRDVGTQILIDGVAMSLTGDTTIIHDGESITCDVAPGINGAVGNFTSNSSIAYGFVGYRFSLPTAEQMINYRASFKNSLLEWERNLSFPASLGSNMNVLQGEARTIYGEQLVNVTIGNNLVVVYEKSDNDLGTQVGNDFVFNPAFIGGVEYLDISIYTGSRLLLKHRQGVYVQGNGETAITKTITMIADSLQSGTPFELDEVRLAFPLMTWTGIGLIGSAPNLREGYPGKTYDWLINHIDSPFTKAGVLDIPAYYTDNGLTVPDFIHMRMGVNEAASRASTGMTRAYLFRWILDIKELVDAFLAHDASVQIFIGMPTSSENTGAGWENNYPGNTNQNRYLSVINAMRREIQLQFHGNRYNSRVWVCWGTWYLDRDEGYPKTDGVHINGVHLDESGYRQYGQGLANDFNNLL